MGAPGRRVEDELRTRVRQQAAVAELGQRALAAGSLEELLEEAVGVVARELDTELVSLLELKSEPRQLVVRAAIGFPEEVLGAALPAAEDEIQGYALQAAGPVVVHDFAAEERFGRSPVQAAAGVVSAMAAPIGARGRHFGVIGAHSQSPRHFGEEDASYLQLVANVVGAAAERGRVEAGLREREARFRELADSAPVMIWTTDIEGAVTFVNRGWLEYTGRTLEEEIGETWTLGVHPDDAPAVLTGWKTALERREPWEHEYRLRRQDGEYRWIVDRGVPHYEGERFAGYVGTATDIHERKSMEERLLRVYEQEHRVAETLQRSLLPERLPAIEGLTLAARYLPAGAGAAVGGDWYDAMELRDGRVALVVGDVVGHGLRAAAVMGQLRNACRAYALVEPSPSNVVARMNSLVSEGGEDVMATVLYIVLDRETGEVVFTSAGHPPPLVLEASGETRFLEGGRSMPVGAGDSATFREERGTVIPGSTLFLYTDGLVERRDVPLEHRLAQLAAAARTSGGELEDVCDQVLSGVLGPLDPSDDVALLAVRPAPVSAERISITLPAEPEVLGALRRRLARFLHAAGASEEESYEITLTISEAAGNAIEHAYGPGDETFEVEAMLEAGELVAFVRDTGSWRDHRGAEHRGRGLRLMEGLMDHVDVSTDAGGTVVRMRRRLDSVVPT
jgi:PAS domain S-box-containing protein